MKEKYVRPEVETIALENNDIITSSCTLEGPDDNNF